MTLPDTLKTACDTNLILTEGTKQHLAAHANDLPLLEEAIGKMTLPTDGGFIMQEIDMGRVVGNTACVEAPRVFSDETALFARRTGRPNPSRVVRNVPKPPTQHFVVLACKDRDNNDAWTLITGYVGQAAPKEPWDPTLIGNAPASAEANEFWSCHALVHEDGWEDPFESNWGTVITNVHDRIAAERDGD